MHHLFGDGRGRAARKSAASPARLSVCHCSFSPPPSTCLFAGKVPALPHVELPLSRALEFSTAFPRPSHHPCSTCPPLFSFSPSKVAELCRAELAISRSSTLGGPRTVRRLHGRVHCVVCHGHAHCAVVHSHVHCAFCTCVLTVLCERVHSPPGPDVL